MHEFSVAKQVCDKALEILDEEDMEKVVDVYVGIGKLSHINEKQFRFCFNNIKKNFVALEESDLSVNEKDVSIECDCGYKGVIEINDFEEIPNKFKCPKCDDPNPSIEKGDEVIIEKIKLED
ncbi:MAG: Zn finger protein HypA/HybF regulating hydrogenase expression [Candidatus Methanohalarchaeum thermophilum]|uniref:Hydrogenase maturation factor HypA n=1 Tax=Methanohalarchaeum thermophilum TaxID=1903181 RepID=A0A1Q6DS32_METT1|nr:MAG: Zn finger protein HypA/HybF regulating hydrogenase expression [Candidatus Methanohalarchaeum thermophilum]